MNSILRLGLCLLIGLDFDAIGSGQGQSAGGVLTLVVPYPAGGYNRSGSPLSDRCARLGAWSASGD